MTTTALTSTAHAPAGRGLGIALWVTQGLLALAFGMAGVMKSTTPPDQLLANGFAWVSSLPAWMPRLIGLVELTAAIGLILPSVTRIRPQLTPLAAAGLVLTMIGASALHVARGEYGVLGVNAVLGGLAAFVAWGRWTKVPIAGR